MDYRTDRVDISTKTRGRLRLPHVTAHETVCFSPVDHTVVNGVPVTAIPRTLIDAGAVHSPRFVEDALDDCIRRGLTTVAEVADRMQATAGQGRDGIGVMRTILEARADLQGETESVLESRFLRALREYAVPLPEAQHVIRLGYHVVARTDFAYPERRLAIEIDGLRFHASRRSLEADTARQNDIILAGYDLLRFTASDLARPQRVAFTVQRLLDAGRSGG